jgi:hypothetical protein
MQDVHIFGAFWWVLLGLANAGCYGILPAEMADWECELCANVRVEENHLVGRIVFR